MKRTKKERYEHGCMLIGILIEQRYKLEAYEAEMKRYLLSSEDWESVRKAECEAKYWGVTQDELNEAKRNAHNSITDEELLTAIGMM